MLIDKSFIRFIIVGILSTLYAIVLTFVLYNFLSFGYWASTGSTYATGMLISYYLNKKYTFKYGQAAFDIRSFLRFLLVVGVSYLVSFSLSRLIAPYFIKRLINSDNNRVIEQLTMLCAMSSYTVLNYFGQKLFAFGARTKE